MVTTGEQSIQATQRFMIPAEQAVHHRRKPKTDVHQRHVLLACGRVR
jgi:hypothetical protein